MKKGQRQTEIIKRLRAVQRELSVEELAAEFEVAELTIRRDLTNLEKQGALVRTHGGCVSVDQAVYESNYHKRVSKNFKLKHVIGSAAEEEVEKGDIICINDGSTAFHLASNLGPKTPLTVYTNSIAMIDELSRKSGVDVYVLGGKYSRNQHSLMGSLTAQMLQTLRFNTVFMGADAVDEQGRVLVMNPDEADMDRKMVEAGMRRILLADHTKIGAQGHAVYAQLSDFDMWITTCGITSELLKKFRGMTTVVIAGGNQSSEFSTRKSSQGGLEGH